MFLKISEDQSNSQRTLEGDIISLRNALPLPVPVSLKYIDLRLESVTYLLTTFSENTRVMLIKQSLFWYIKTFALFLLIPIRMFALYYMDILSDVAQTFTLFNNCHGDYGAISFAIIASSYLFSSIYIKLVDNLKWFQSFMHPYTTGWVKWHLTWITVQALTFT